MDKYLDLCPECREKMLTILTQLEQESEETHTLTVDELPSYHIMDNPRR